MIGELSSLLKKFSVSKLFGYKNVSISFESNVKILVGENGTGKTTVLNLLYYSLTCSFSELIEIPFETIAIEFASGNTVTINHEDFEDVRARRKEVRHSNRSRHLENEIKSAILRYIPREELQEVAEKYIGKTSYVNFRGSPWVQRISKRTPFLESEIAEVLVGMLETEFLFNSERLNWVRNAVNKEVSDLEILYFPTYRRIEEELSKLGIEEYNDSLIHFGMADVKRVLKTITSDITDSTMKWFSKLTGGMLSQLIERIDFTSDMASGIEVGVLRIVLDRVGENINGNNKSRIIHLVESGEINQAKYNHLAYFLIQLIKIYEDQREQDERIRQFAKICNAYLVGKEVRYDESLVQINFEQNGRPIDVAKLSSGEKQLVSLFTRIFLTVKKDFIILIDEPELSLSIEWQPNVLPDILASKRCRFMLAVTHSPFMFENELDQYANAIGLYIKHDTSLAGDEDGLY